LQRQGSETLKGHKLKGRNPFPTRWGILQHGCFHEREPFAWPRKRSPLSTAQSRDIKRRRDAARRRQRRQEMKLRTEALLRECLAGKVVTSPRRHRVGSYHRGSKFMSPVPVMTDRNLLAKLLWEMRAREQRTRQERRERAAAEKLAEGRKKARPVHRGDFGSKAIEIFRVLLFELPKLNGLHPTHATLMARVGVTKPTLISAIRRIITAGFMTVYRRIVRLPDGRVVQTSCSYEPHPPTGLGALGWPSWKSSGLKNLTQHKTQVSKKEGNALCQALTRLRIGVKEGKGVAPDGATRAIR